MAKAVQLKDKTEKTGVANRQPAVGEEIEQAGKSIASAHEDTFQNFNNKKYATEPGFTNSQIETDQLRARRQQSHEVLRTAIIANDSERRFRALIENSADIIILTDGNGKLFYGSPTIRKVFDYTVEEYVHLPIFNFIHPDDIPELIKNTRRIAHNPGDSFHSELRVMHNDGKWIWCEGTTTNLLHEPSVNAFVSNFRDISERKHAELTIKKGEAFNRGVLDSLVSHISIIDRTGKIIAVNNAWERFSVENGKSELRSTGIGSNYFKVCEKAINEGDVIAAEALQGIKEVLHQNSNVFYMEYPCNSPAKERWFGMRVMRFESDETRAVISHIDVTERKIAEKTVLKKEAMLAEAQLMAKIGSWETDLLDLKVIWSDETYRIFESEPGIENLTHSQFLEFVHPDDREKVNLVFLESLDKHTINLIEHRIVTGTGLIKTVEERWQIFFNSQDQPVTAAGTVQDITDRKKAEQIIEKSEKRYRQIVETAQEGIWVIDENNLTTFVNKKMCEILEYTEEEMMGRSNLSFKDPEEQIIAMQQIERRKNGVKEINESKFITRSGRHIITQVSTNPILNEDGSYAGALAMMTDITQRKLIENKLAKSESQLKEAQAIAHIGNFEVDVIQNTEVWSDEMYKIYGLTIDEITPSKELFLSFIHPDDVEYVRTEMQEFRKTFRSSNADFRFMRKDGTLRYGYTEARFEFDRYNKPTRIFGIFQDITERKLAEIERSKITIDLIQRNKNLEQFSYIISHNLRAPVANILGAIDVLNQPGLSIDDKAIFNHALNDSVKKLDAVVKDLNQILQVEAQIKELKEKVVFSTLVNNIKTSIEQLISNADIEITYDFSEVDELYTLKSCLHSIFYNLITNSIKYRRKEVPCVITVKSRKTVEKIELIFTDNGTGINMQKKADQVFGLYKRFHNDIEGKGIGLFMVKTQVETLGGMISLKSEINQGTEFKVEFFNEL